MEVVAKTVKIRATKLGHIYSTDKQEMTDTPEVQYDLEVIHSISANNLHTEISYTASTSSTFTQCGPVLWYKRKPDKMDSIIFN